MLSLELNANVRGQTPHDYSSGTNAADVNKRGDLIVAAGLPPLTETVRMGKSWMTVIPTGSAFTYVNAWPTTRAELVLRNCYTDGTLIVLESAFMVDVTSAAAAQSKALLAQLVPAHAAVTNDTTVLVTSRSGHSYGTGAGKAERDLALTTMTADKWELIGGTNNVQAASIGANVNAFFGGGWILKTTDAVGLAGVASTAAGTAIIGLVWHELEVDIPS